MKRFESLNHTADMGLTIYGKDIKELFSNAAYGMFNIITDLDKITKQTAIEITLKANNLEELLVVWLNELLYHYSTARVIFNKFDIQEIDKNHLISSVYGEKIDSSKCEINTEIKAVTYHQLKIKHTLNHKRDSWQAQIIFDV